MKDKIINLLLFAEKAKKLSNKNIIVKDINYINSISKLFEFKNWTYDNLLKLWFWNPLLFFVPSKNFEIIAKTFVKIKRQLKHFKNYNPIDLNKELEIQLNDLNKQKTIKDNNIISDNIDDENLLNQYL